MEQQLRPNKPPVEDGTNPESGFVLLAVLFMVVLLLIGLAVAAPKVATDIRRDKELELYHRGMQYARAVRLYYKKFGSYPVSLDQLESSNNIRFLRRRYKDPITGKDEWRLIHMGEAIAAQTNSNGQQTGVPTANGQPGTSSSSGFGGSGASSFGNSFGSSGGSSFGNSFGGSGGSSFGNSFGGNSGGSSFGNSFGSPGSGSSSLGNGSTSGSTGSTSDSNSANGGNGIGTGTGLGGSTLSSSNGSPIGAAGPIVGVASTSTKESIRVYKKQTHYNKWEFVYDPNQDMGGLAGANGTGVLPQNGTGTSNPFGNSFGNSSGSGTGSSGSGFGNSFGSGNSGFGNTNSNPGNGNNNGSTNSNQGTSPGNGPTNPNPTPAPPPTQNDSPQQ